MHTFCLNIFFILLTAVANSATTSCILRSAEVCKTPEGFKDAVELGCANETSNCLKKFCNHNCSVPPSCRGSESCFNYCPQGDVKELCRKNCMVLAIADEDYKAGYCFISDFNPEQLSKIGQEKNEELRKRSMRKSYEVQLKDFEFHLRRSEELRALLTAKGAAEFIDEIEQKNVLFKSRLSLSKTIKSCEPAEASKKEESSK